MLRGKTRQEDDRLAFQQSADEKRRITEMADEGFRQA
jgi:hypothetical protein